MENAENNFSSIQEIMAKLVTNPRYAMKALENPKRFAEQFGFGENISRELKKFLNKNGNNFVSSSLLLKKKRFDAVITTLQILNKIYAHAELENMWERYLTMIGFDEKISKNPLFESVLFCEYILNHERQNKVQSGLTEYEISRNKIIIEHGQHEKSYYHLAINFETLDQSDYLNVAPFVHPCTMVKCFSFNISELVQFIIRSQNLSKLDQLYKKSSEMMLFCKNWIKGGILAVKISEVIKNAICMIDEVNNLFEWKSILCEKLNMGERDFNNLMAMLIRSGIIIVISNEQREVSHV